MILRRHLTVRLPRLRFPSRTAFLAILFAVASLATRASLAAPPVILVPEDAAPVEVFAAREVRRYTWLRTGELLAIQTAGSLPSHGEALVVGSRGHALVAAAWAPDRPGNTEPVPAGTHRLLTRRSGDRRHVLYLSGMDGPATLYAAYGWARHLGVRFQLHGDVLPDYRQPLTLPDLDEYHTPLFSLRGIQPFHDFPEGPDWWNADDYRAVISQLPKLGMNFIALHTYPEGRPNAEPTVWIGSPGDFDAAGRVGFAYPASYQNTLRGNWGYHAKPTSAFTGGTSALFDRDGFGPTVMRDLAPEPTSLDGTRAVFDRTGDLLRTAFTHAHRLGVKTCVGTETPLVVPRVVSERRRTAGVDPDSPAARQRWYEGIFARAAAAYPLDYYWFWTPEGWTWEGTPLAQVQATTNDLAAAIAAHAAVRPPFQLATCGWVLGPAQDRALFDKVLPKSVAVSCINREVGRTPVEPGFREVQGRGKWAIPWLEDDPALTSPQLWAGRMRRDAADALDYGCDGLLGIHWRTRVLGPAVAALAQAGWEQPGWRGELLRRREAGPVAAGAAGFVVGGQAAAFPGHAIADTTEPAVYRTVRYDLRAYRLRVSEGPCQVTLRFCEPHYREPGKRVFDVVLQGRKVIEALDIFGRVGADRALDFTFEAIQPTNGVLEIAFEPRVEYPSIAAISVQGGGTSLNIDCGGPGAGRFAADLPNRPLATEAFAPTDDFYRDWAMAEFGPEIATDAAVVFARIDGRLPRPSDWVDGPGGLKPDPRPWSQVRTEYEFVDTLAALAPRVRGAGASARFTWWLETFRYLRSMGELDCAWAVFQRVFSAATNGPSGDPNLRALTLDARRNLVRLRGEVYAHLLATVSNPGELGTLANWEQHIQPDVFDRYDEALARLAGGTLPPDCTLATRYTGATRLIVPTAPTSLPSGERLHATLLVLAEAPVRDVAVFVRPLGTRRFARLGPEAVVHVERGVYHAEIPPPPKPGSDLEWYAEVIDDRGIATRWPATAPALGQTVVVEPEW